MQCLVLLSGGIDSALCLYRARDMSRYVRALFFDYGQPSRTHDFHMVLRLASKTCVPVERVVLPLERTPMSERGEEGPRIVPHRNALFIATAMANYPETSHLWIGANRDDASTYLDCQEAYLKTLGALLGVEIVTLCDMSKGAIVQELRQWGCDVERDTTSCYNGTDCGFCRACRERAAALCLPDGDKAQP